MYIYPENLKAKPMLWLWELRDVAIIVSAVLLSVFALAQTGSFALLIGAVLYAFLSIRVEDNSVLGFLCFAARFLLLQQQYFEWEEPYHDTHEAIISDELFHAVQEERLQRSRNPEKTLAMSMMF